MNYRRTLWIVLSSFFTIATAAPIPARAQEDPLQLEQTLQELREQWSQLMKEEYVPARRSPKTSQDPDSGNSRRKSQSSLSSKKKSSKSSKQTVRSQQKSSKKSAAAKAPTDKKTQLSSKSNKPSSNHNLSSQNGNSPSGQAKRKTASTKYSKKR